MNKNRLGSVVAMAARRAGFSVMIGATGVLITLPLSAQAQPAAEAAVLPTAAPGTAGRKNQATKMAGRKNAASAKTSAALSPPAATPVCTGEFPPTVNVNLPEGKSGLLDLQQLKLPAPAWLRTIGNPDVLRIEPLTSKEARNVYYLFGQKIGATNLMFQNRDGRCAMVEVSVGVDTASLQAKLSQLMPREKNIRIGAAADSLVLSGTVTDAMAAEKVLSIANAYVRKGSGGGAPGGGVPGGSSGAGGERIVNMLSVVAPQQVMLEVKVAEISKTLLDKFGINFARQFTTDGGAWTKFISGLLGGEAGAFSQNNNATSKISNGVLTPTQTAIGPGSQDFTKLGIDAQKQDGLVKILAEPTIMAISGQEGSFLAGGKIFIPVPQSSAGGGASTITLEEKEFGVGVRFTPTVLDGGRINLKVAPEVSELAAQGASISGSGTGVTSIIPLITTRRATTTVQLFDGQSFAIGGLIKNNVTQNISAFPFLGEIPVLGALFRSSTFQTDRSELVFIITPRLVKPLPPDYALPTDSFVEPSRSEFFLGGKMEGAAPAAKPAPAATPMPTSKTDTPSGFEIK